MSRLLWWSLCVVCAPLSPDARGVVQMDSHGKPVAFLPNPEQNIYETPKEGGPGDLNQPKASSPINHAIVLHYGSLETRKEAQIPSTPAPTYRTEPSLRKEVHRASAPAYAANSGLKTLGGPPGRTVKVEKFGGTPERVTEGSYSGGGYIGGGGDSSTPYMPPAFPRENIMEKAKRILADFRWGKRPDPGAASGYLLDTMPNTNLIHPPQGQIGGTASGTWVPKDDECEVDWAVVKCPIGWELGPTEVCAADKYTMYMGPCGPEQKLEKLSEFKKRETLTQCDVSNSRESIQLAVPCKFHTDRCRPQYIRNGLGHVILEWNDPCPEHFLSDGDLCKPSSTSRPQGPCRGGVAKESSLFEKVRTAYLCGLHYRCRDPDVPVCNSPSVCPMQYTQQGPWCVGTHSNPDCRKEKVHSSMPAIYAHHKKCNLKYWCYDNEEHPEPNFKRVFQVPSQGCDDGDTVVAFASLCYNGKTQEVYHT